MNIQTVTIHFRVFASKLELHVGISSHFIHSPLPYFKGPKEIGQLASQLFLISQVYSIFSLVQV